MSDPLQRNVDTGPNPGDGVRHSEIGTMFTNARNLRISGGQFNISQTSLHTGLVTNESFLEQAERRNKLERAIKDLQSNVASGASYDCAERSDIPKCHAETREAIIANIRHWAKDLGHSQHFLWLYGPAGCGKTTIAETIAELCDKEGDLLASFFFSRSADNRPREKTRFVATIAEQLCLSIPAIREHIAVAVDRDPRIFSRALSKQMERLIMEPLKTISVQMSYEGPQAIRPKLIVVDGLDECDGAPAQVEILELLIALASASQPVFHLRFLVASRQEHPIQATFSKKSMNGLTQWMPLDNDYQADVDILKYLKSRFADIRESHPGRAYLPADWPTEDQLDYLVKKASGQFIYASVVMNWIESAHRLPVDRLEAVLTLSSAGSTNDMPFAQLDNLYNHVLSQLDSDNLEKGLKIVSWMVLDNVTKYKTPSLADMLFSYHPGESRIVLTGINALIDLSGPPPPNLRQRRKPSMQIPIPTPAGDATGGLDHGSATGFSIAPALESSGHNTPESRHELADFTEHDRKVKSYSLRFFHASFGDFLLDRSRSGRFAIDIYAENEDLARRWIRYFSTYAADSIKLAHEKDAVGVSVIDVTQAVFHHCGGASLTSELQDDLYNLDLRPTLTIVSYNPSETWWPQVFLIINFIIWLEGQIFPDPKKDLYGHYLDHLKTSVGIHWANYPLRIRKFLPIFLTFPPRIQLPQWAPPGFEVSTMSDFLRVSSPADRDHYNNVLDFGDYFQSADVSILGDAECFAGARSLFSRTKVLLFHILTDFQFITAGSYLKDGQPYTDVAHLLAKEIKSSLYDGWGDGLIGDGAILVMVLTKASPDVELAKLLREKALQFEKPVGLQGSQTLEALSFASLLFIKESGVPFREHTHPPNFHPDHWHCAICKTEEWEVDLSVDPTPEPLVALQEPGFNQGVVFARFAPRFLRIQIWFVWLVEILRRVLLIY